MLRLEENLRRDFDGRPEKDETEICKTMFAPEFITICGGSIENVLLTRPRRPVRPEPGRVCGLCRDHNLDPIDSNDLSTFNLDTFKLEFHPEQ
jgi:hypothetical protein